MYSCHQSESVFHSSCLGHNLENKINAQFALLITRIFKSFPHNLN